MDEKRYREYLKLAKTITKGDERYQDLLHDVLIQLESNDKWNNIFTKKEQIYFLSRALSNQFNSNNSQFQRTYRRFTFEQIEYVDKVETEYHEKPTMDWVKERLEKEVNERPESWYRVGLFKMFMEHKKIEPIHKRTRIPKYSIRATIKEMKQWLNQEWEKQNYGTD